MNLHVGLIAPPWLPVSPASAGAVESMLARLAIGLDAAGCTVVLFTTGDSTCPVERRSCFPAALGSIDDARAETIHVERAYRELAGMDVIHDHTVAGLSRIGAAGRLVPTVVTAHGQFTRDLRRLYSEAAARVAVTAVSWSQRRSAPDIPMAAVIHHGVDIDEFPAGQGDSGYVLFMGRMQPPHGAHRAIGAARKAGKKILLAAKIHDAAEHRYFAGVVAPMLGDDAVYVGDVVGESRRVLLSGAEAMLHPHEWAEPFSHVMIESLACGTPVLAFAAGAAQEIVDHGQTGFICSDVEDMAHKLGSVPDLDRVRCRTSVQVSFSTERMVGAYLDVYRRAAGVSRSTDRSHRRHAVAGPADDRRVVALTPASGSPRVTERTNVTTAAAPRL